MRKGWLFVRLGMAMSIVAFACLGIKAAGTTVVPPGSFAKCSVISYSEKQSTAAAPQASSSTNAPRRLLSTVPAQPTVERSWVVRSQSNSNVTYAVKQTLNAATGGTITMCAYSPNRVLATLAKGKSYADFVAGMTAKGFKVVRELMKDRDGNSVYIIESTDAEHDVVDQMTMGIQSTGFCSQIEPDHIFTTSVTPRDPKYAEQWGMEKIGAPKAWNTRTDASSVLVAVLDTGVNFDHIDLNQNLWMNEAETVDMGNGEDDDGNGLVDDVYGMASIGGNVSGNPADDNSHGSHCAGVIGAVGNNRYGVAGIAWKAKVMGLKFLDASGSGSVSDAITCLVYAAQKGVKVVSCSFGSTQFDSYLYEQIEVMARQGVIFVCAAGNLAAGDKAEYADNDDFPCYPASYACSNIVAVAATDRNDNLASFSHYGVRSVDIAAPGVDIVSTVLGSMAYDSMNGTSMATPHVAGALALLMAEYPDESPYDIVERLYAAGEEVASLKGKVRTGKRLSLENFFGLPAPSAVTASQGTIQDAVGLYWTAVANATHYRVWRADAVDGSKTALCEWMQGLTYSDETALAGSNYWYFVQAAASAEGADASAYSEGVPGFRPEIPENRVTVTFNANGGTVGEAKRNYTAGDTYGEFPTATYSGRVFLGWHTAATGGTRVDAASVVKADVTTLFAHWATSGELRVENLAAQQRYPWNGKVDVMFDLNGVPNKEYASLALTAKDAKDGKAFSLATYEGTAPTNLAAGAHRVVWNADADKPNALFEELTLNATASIDVPRAPASGTASNNVAAGGIDLAWTAAHGASSYEIWRSTSSTLNSAAKLLDCAELTCLDGSCTMGTYYYYWIKSKSSSGTSKDSLALEAWRGLLPPKNVSATDGTSSEKVTVTWTASDGATGYDVYRSAGTSSGSASKIASVSVTSYVDTSATAGKQYYYWVKATVSGYESEFSTYDGGWKKLSVPTGVSATDGTYSDKVAVSWSSSTGATSYEIWRGTSTSSGSAAKLGTTTSTSYNDTSATAGTQYYYWIKAVCTLGASEFSAYDGGYRRKIPTALTINGASSVNAGASTTYTATATYNDGSSKTVTPTWSLSSGSSYGLINSSGVFTADGTATQRSVTVAANYTENGATVSTTKGVTITTFTVTITFNGNGGTPSSQTQTYTAYGTYSTFPTSPSWTGYTPAGWYTSSSGGSQVTSSTLVPSSNTTLYMHWSPVVPSAPSNVSATDGTSTANVTISWSAVSGATSYYVYRSTSNSSGSATQLGSTSSTSYADTTATPGVTYYYWVKAYRSDNGQYSAFSSSNTGYRKLSAPTNVSATDGTYTDRVIVSWNSVTGADKYYVYRYTSNSSGSASQLGSTASTSYTDTMASPGVTYYYWVKAYANSSSSYSDFSSSNSGYRLKALTSLTINGPDALDAGTNATYTCTATYSDNSTATVTPSWSITDGSSYASINSSGKLTANASTVDRSVTIYASYSDNGTATATKTIAIRKVIPLSTALDSTDLVFTTGGNSNWVGVVDVSYDGIDSARSGLIGHNQSTWLQTTVTGPGTLSFRWKVSSESGCDKLTFILDGTTKDTISGTSMSSFAEKIYTLESGEHSIKWVYSKDSSVSSGSDCGWVDKVEYTLITKPNAPTGVSATQGASSDQVTLNWTAVTGATSYEVWRSTSSSSSTATRIDTVTTPGYADTSAVAGTTYYYWITAVNLAGASVASTRISGYRLKIPTGLTINGDSSVRAGRSTTYTATATYNDGSSKTVTPAWSLSSGSSYGSVNSSGVFTAIGTATLRNVTVAASYIENGVTVSNTKGVTITTFTVTITFNGNGGSPSSQTQTYTAYGAYGSFPTVTRTGYTFAGWFTAASGGTQVTTSSIVPTTNTTLYAHWTAIVPDAPTNVSATDGTYSDKVTISWSSVSGATKYYIYRNTSNDSSSATEIGNTTSTSYSDTTAAVGTTYYYWVKAYRSDNGQYSAVSSSDAGYARLNPPTNVKVSASSGVSVSWSTVTGATSYKVMRGTTSTYANSKLIGTVTTTDFADTTSEPETDYYYWIIAVCANGESEISASAHLSGWTLNVPTGILASDGTDTTGVQINWTAVPNATSYQILRDGESVGTSSSNEYFDKSAVMGMRYKYSVKSCAGTHSSTASGEDAGWPRLNLTGKYVVVDMTGGTNAWFFPVTQMSSEPSDWRTSPYKMVLRRIEPGSFMMGDPSCDPEYADYREIYMAYHKNTLNNYDYHKVTLTKAYYFGISKMTDDQLFCIKERPRLYWEGSCHEMYPSTVTAAKTGLRDLLSGKCGIALDLPTDAEWEYACRAGTTTAFNYDNAWGLYDMHDGYQEMCRDKYRHHLGTSAVVDPYVTEPEDFSNTIDSYHGCANVLRGGYYTNCNYNNRNHECYARDNTRVGGDYWGAAYRPFCYAGLQGEGLLTFVGQGGVGNMVSLELKKGTIALPKNAYVKDGAQFLGWATKPNSAEVVYQDGETITVNNVPQTIALYAVWAWNISFNANGGSGTQNSMRVDSGTKLPDCTYYKSGSVFLGWSTSAFGGVVYKAGSPIPSEELSTTFYAKWGAPSKTYLIVDLSGGTSAANYPISELDNVPSGGWTDEYKTNKLVLRRIASGSYTMGCESSEVGYSGYEAQPHSVTISKPFYMGVFEVTQKQYELVMGSNPSSYKGDARPVEYVSYNTIRGSLSGAIWPSTNLVDSTSFMGKIRARTGLTFDLPTEAQWEYACRAGTTTALNSGKNLTNGSSDANMAEVGRYAYNTSDGKGGYSSAHTTVGSYLPNNWGLYDMHGNVFEWCLDWYVSRGTSGFDSGAVTDPRGAASGSTRVRRGGSWYNNAQYCRSATRSYSIPSSAGNADGFRLCCPAKR